MKKLIVLFLVIFLLALSGNLYAEKKGAKLVVEKKDGQLVRGELIAVKNSSLLLLDSEGADVSVDIGDIKIIKIVKKSKALLGGSIGFALFSFYGVASVESMGGLGTNDNPIVVYSLVALMFGAVGAIPGLLFGEVAGIDKKIQIEGKSDSEIKEILEKLRKKARVPDYQ